MSDWVDCPKCSFKDTCKKYIIIQKMVADQKDINENCAKECK